MTTIKQILEGQVKCIQKYQIMLLKWFFNNAS